jgi:hypothetical protein
MYSMNDTYSSEFKLELLTALELCEVIDSPRSLSVYLLLKGGEWNQYLDLDMDPARYECDSAFADDLLVTKVLSKSPNLPTGIDRVAEAILSFTESERSCKRINDRFVFGHETSFPIVITEMRFEIFRILGSLTRNKLEYILNNTRNGPGATTSVRGVGSTPSDKYTEGMHLTANLLPFYRVLTGDLWRNLHKRARLVKGSKFITVPKNAKTDRGICIEPTLNVFLQLGIGACIRKSLRVSGLDLDIQAIRNRKGAERAYRDDLCTIDLSSASDSIAKNAVRFLMPPDWCHLLELARSPTTKVAGDVLELEKISSMGNGFTFELESLLFWALARVIVPRDQHNDVYVFGDDIILPRHYASVYIEALNFLGFSVNRAKSFLDGNFFESCGSDFFKGHPVRPFHLKGGQEGEGIPYSLQIANKLRLYSRLRGKSGCSHRFRALWIKLVGKVPRLWRKCRVPDFLGDVGLVTDSSELIHFKDNPRYFDGHEGFYVLTVQLKPVQRKCHSIGVLLHVLARSASRDSPTYGKLPVRGFLGAARPRWTLIVEWPSSLRWDDKS